MESNFATPRDLVQALHDRSEGAREALSQWVQDPVKHLLGAFILEHGLQHDPELLHQRALRSVEIFLRSRKPAEFEGMSQRAFQGTILFFCSKTLCRPEGGEALQVIGPDPLPDHPTYQSRRQ
jgi:hypothetical protein